MRSALVDTEELCLQTLNKNLKKIYISNDGDGIINRIKSCKHGLNKWWSRRSCSLCHKYSQQYNGQLVWGCRTCCVLCIQCYDEHKNAIDFALNVGIIHVVNNQMVIGITGHKCFLSVIFLGGLFFSMIIRMIIYITGAVMGKINDNTSIPNIYAVLSIVFGIPIFIIVCFIAYNLTNLNKRSVIYLLSHIYTLVVYLFTSIITGLQQAPYLQYRVNHGYSGILYSFMNQFKLSSQEKEYRYIVLQFYLMANYLVAYESRKENKYLQYNNDKMMDYKQICLDNYYNLEYTQIKSNIFHNAMLDVRQCHKEWKYQHFVINTVLGCLFYFHKITLWLFEIFISYLILIWIEDISDAILYYCLYWIWFALNITKNLFDIYKFYFFINFNKTVNSYYFDNHMLSSILSWKKLDTVLDEINLYYWDFTTRITFKEIIYQYLNEKHIATIIQSYIGSPPLTLTSVRKNSFINYYKNTRKQLIYCEGF